MMKYASLSKDNGGRGCEHVCISQSKMDGKPETQKKSLSRRGRRHMRPKVARQRRGEGNSIHNILI